MFDEEVVKNSVNIIYDKVNPARNEGLNWLVDKCDEDVIITLGINKEVDLFKLYRDNLRQKITDLILNYKDFK